MGDEQCPGPAVLADSEYCPVLQLDLSDINLTPREVVERLDKHIVGQVCTQFVLYNRMCNCSHIHATQVLCILLLYSTHCAYACFVTVAHFPPSVSICCSCLVSEVQSDAKRAVANALRNRWRRHKIASPMKVGHLNAMLSEFKHTSRNSNVGRIPSSVNSSLHNNPVILSPHSGMQALRRSCPSRLYNASANAA